jgi:hypothetical protein
MVTIVRIVVHLLEKRLGRKLNDWDWQVGLEDPAEKAAAETRQKLPRAWQARSYDPKIIHDFVWNES